MANAIASQVQALYVGYLGRAADQAGLNFWTNAITAGTSTLESVALGFTLSAEYESLYAGKTNEELAAAIYENVLGRAADADGLAFWVGELSKGVQTPETLLAAMLNSLGAVDQKVIDNKVFVANAYTEAAGADYDAEVGAQVLEGVDGTAASVAAALASVPAINSAGLTAALADWTAANEAKAAFLESLDLDDDASTPTQASDVADLIDSSVGGSPVATFNGNTYASISLGTISTSAQQTAAFAAARANFDSAIADQEAVIASRQATVTALNDAKDVAAYRAALLADVAAGEALTAAEAAEAGAAAKFNFVASNDIDVSDITIDLATGVVTVDGTNFADDYVVADNSGTVGVVKAVAGVTVSGIAALVDAINARLAAEFADAAAGQDVLDARALVGDGTNTNAGYAAVDALVEQEEILADLQEEGAALEEAIAGAKEAYALNVQLEALNDAIEDAIAVIEDADVNVTVLSGAGVPVANENDLFIVDIENSDGTETINAGFAAGDRIYVGADYSLVVLGEDKAISDSIGSSSALEVIWDAATSSLYVETAAFGGNSASTSELIDITLTGVTGDLVVVDGYIQLA